MTRATTILDCLLAAARACGCTVAELSGTGRSGRAILAREVAVWLARKSTTGSYPEIAALTTGHAHSSWIAAHRRVCDGMDTLGSRSRLTREVDPSFPATRREACARAEKALAKIMEGDCGH